MSRGHGPIVPQRMYRSTVEKCKPWLTELNRRTPDYVVSSADLWEAIVAENLRLKKRVRYLEISQRTPEKCIRFQGVKEFR